MEILNFGECIGNGNYQIHSKFKNVYNYSNSTDLISIVSEQIGRGPNNIVVNSLPNIANKNLLINNSGIHIGEMSHYPINISKPQKSLDLFLTDLTILSSRIGILTDYISDKCALKSLAFLLFPERSAEFQTSFEIAFREHALKAVNNLSLDALPKIVRKMKGIGFGLTPSGDDFNCGILYALNYLKKAGLLINLNILDNCYQNSLGKNLISNTFLKYAYLNKFYENFYNLLKSLRSNAEKELFVHAKKIISTGHTSGSDMLTGFILTIKGVLNDKKFS